MTPLSAWRRGARPLPFIFGHRGVRGGAPENTLAAFDLAAREGADGVELDVRTCATGELVVIHDPTLERVTGGADTRPVAEVPYDELRRADVGGGERVPALHEVLALARARRLRVNIEMKHDAAGRLGVVFATARLLRAQDPRLPVLVSSFDPRMLVAFHAVLPRVPTALLVNDERRYRHMPRLGAPIGASALHVERTRTAPAAVRQWLAEGFVVNVWTVNDPGEARDLAALGIDGLITDVPGELRAALG